MYTQPTSPVIIAGAGIAGLSVAYELQKRNIPYVVLEAGPQAGGVIRSCSQQGFELDTGPNSIAATPATMAYIKELGLEDAVEEAAPLSKHRFLVRNNQLHAVSPHPLKILQSRYISGSAKWRLFSERFRKAQPAGEEESVASFVTRRFGREICDYLFEPVLSGIYAGDLHRLSVQETLPMLPKWEQQYGSVTRGLMQNREAMSGRRIIAFRGGNQVLVQRLQSLLTGAVMFNCAITGVAPLAKGYTVQYNGNGQTKYMDADHVIFTTPAYSTAASIQLLDAPLAAALQHIPYPRMGVLHLGFGEEALAKAPQGFGFLVPHAAGLHFLGAICNSAIFPSHAPAGKALFTVFVGGARQEQLLVQHDDAALQQLVTREFMQLLRLQTPPELQRFSRWERAIPQPNVGHAKVRSAIKRFEERFPGLHIGGSYVSGVAVPAILQDAGRVAGIVHGRWSMVHGTLRG